MVKNFLLIVCTALLSVFFYENTTVLDTKEQSEKNVSKFIQIKGVDELVVTEIQNNENFSDSSCTGGRVWFTNWCMGRGNVNVSFDAHYKYHVKLGELKYTLEDDTLVFKVPDLYLSKPVGYDKLATNCDTTGIGSCSPVYEYLLPNVAGYLENKGILGLQNARENAAKSLADNFFEFAKNNNNLFFKKISVIFVNENGKSSRDFNYSSGYCEGNPCKFDFKVNDFGVKFK
jgi:hypothetical protein